MVMMLISFTVSEYEYNVNKVINTNQFEKAFEQVNITEHIAPTESSDNFNATAWEDKFGIKAIEESAFNLTKLESNETGGLNSTDLSSKYKTWGEIVEASRHTSIDSWKASILSTSEYGEPFLRFILTAIISLGAFFQIMYQSYGMAGLPIYLIKGTKSLEAENTEIETTIQTVRDKLRQI